ncbi:MAG: SusC/RagA family TonB-linked outer membrane protein, partial [Muribaculaceae bacterium]|nr:SusC/RagA family TonB-linked outer membrane protein [Muribaculaceae bacterium]
ANLTISYVGYLPYNGKPGATPPEITLKEDTQMLDEVVVIGYGTTTRKAAVGAIDQVKGEKFANRPVQTMTQALQGAAPNVIIQSNSYDPNNQDTRFNIRGVTSTTNSDPLFVIDGIVSDGGAFNRLNPNDVENISVLKDAGAAAIYGSRSAAGVVLVTTKGGKKDQPATVSFSANVGWEDPYYQYTAVDGYQNALLYNMALTNVGRNPKFSPADITDLYNHRSEERWALDEITRTAMMQKYNVMVQGGTNKVTYMFSLGYFDQESNLVGHNNKGVQRYNMRMNIGTDIGRLHLGAIMSFVRNDSRTSTANLSNCYANSKRTPKYYYNNLTDAEGRYVANSTVSDQHALAELNSDGYNKYRNNDWQGNINADFKIIDGLKLRGVLGVNVHNETRNTRAIPYGYYSNTGVWQEVSAKDYSASNWNSDYYAINSQLLLDFNRTFGKHSVNAMFGFTNESTTYSANEINKKFVDPDLGTETDQTKAEAGNITGKTFLEDNNRSSISSW